MSTYENILEWMYRQLPAFETSGKDGYKPGLATTEALNTLFGNPSRSFKTVHIAGTNGKGSTAHSLAAVLQSAGYRTGLYTSPHLVDFSERIRVNGEPVSHEFVVEFIEEYRKKKASIAPTFFELTTIMAFEWFRRQRVDIAVIETGLGGRLDSTNIITPMLSVITNISLDHTDLLGNTLEAIAAEKAGIIKAGVPVVIGEGGPESERAVFRVKAEETGSPIMFADEKPWFTACQQEGFTQKYIGTPFGDITADLVGECQQKNMATILASLSVLKENGLKISDEAVRNGLSQVCKLTHLLGRWTCLSERPLLIIDTGHNPGGWENTAKEIAAIKVGTRHLVIGFVADKDVATVVGMIAGIPDVRLYVTQPSSHRALPAAELLKMVQQAGIEAESYANVAAAAAAAKKNAASDDMIFIGGSNYLVGEYLSLGQD